MSERKREKRDDAPSPPRPAAGDASLSIASLLSLARKNEEKIDNALSGKTSKKRPLPSQRESSSAVRETHSEEHAEMTQENAKNNKKKKNKRKKHKPSSDGEAGATEHTNAVPAVTEDEDEDDEERDDYPYPVDGDDHCESPIEAYQDILPLLSLYATSIEKNPDTLSIYDPFFCEGSVKQRLAGLGFTQVYNEKEDFYATVRRQTVPAHDLLLTNPPYSANHMERLLQFVVQQNNNKPFCLLIPNYVYTKDYFAKIVNATNNNVFFVTPKKRYLYTTPKGRRQQKSAKVTSPFPTFWYCGNFKTDVINKLVQAAREQGVNCAFNISRNAATIPIEVAPDNDPRKKKLRNNLKRKKNKDKKKNTA